MEIKEFIQHFAEQFDDTDVVSFTPDTVYKNLEEWSSLIALAIIAMVDEEYGVIVKGEDIRESETIKDLFEVVKARK